MSSGALIFVACWCALCFAFVLGWIVGVAVKSGALEDGWTL